MNPIGGILPVLASRHNCPFSVAAGVHQYESELITSPPALVPSASQTGTVTPGASMGLPFPSKVTGLPGLL